MSRADDLRAALGAEVAVVELEDELTRLKALKRPDEAKLRETKQQLRAARQRHRELRAGVPAGEGDAVASPPAVDASASVEQPG
ncbi:MAG TPA: hypothetical protein VHM23_19690 [Actinomycetota bacterium]|nr:hypothetical protein [Actinomycetota bacterium]